MPANRSSVRRRTSITPARKGKTTKNASSTGGDLYQLESLKDYEVRNGIEYFLVKWEGYPDEQNTWEPVSNIVHPTQDLIDQMKELRLMSQASQKSTKVRKSSSKKRKIESITDKKSRPIKSQKVVSEQSRTVRSRTHPNEAAKENIQPNQCMSSSPQESPIEHTENQSSAPAFLEGLPVHDSSQTASLQSPKTSSHNEEDTSPEEASASHIRFDKSTLRETSAPTPPAQSALPLHTNEQVRQTHVSPDNIVVETVCKEPRALPYENQENFLPICSEGLQFLSHLSVVVRCTQVVQAEGSDKIEVQKVKMPLLEAAEKHTKALLAYFLQNVRYYKHSKPNLGDAGQHSQPAATQQCDAGTQADIEIKESQTQTCDSASIASSQPSPDEEQSPPVTPNDRRSVATVPNSAASKSASGKKLVTVG